MLSFCVLAQSPCLIRLTYQAVYCLELRFRANRLVSIRDGASSRFERNVVEEFTPIQGLKAFLSKYVDESAVPWRLLDIDVLVEDKETGGKESVILS